MRLLIASACTALAFTAGAPAARAESAALALSAQVVVSPKGVRVGPPQHARATSRKTERQEHCHQLYRACRFGVPNDQDCRRYQRMCK